MSKWTLFWDMHSGGSTKQPPYEMIYIEAPEEEAIRVFANRFGHHPLSVACPCCGSNYAVHEHDSLEEATAFHRRQTRYNEERDEFYNVAEEPLYIYVQRPEVRVIKADAITLHERDEYPPEPEFARWEDDDAEVEE